jgi:hypothetical protein
MQASGFVLVCLCMFVCMPETSDSWRKPINIKFEIPYFTVSGIQVRYLKVVEKSGYQALPWVRYITRGGDYQVSECECVGRSTGGCLVVG